MKRDPRLGQIDFARDLRRFSTEAEKRLWAHLRGRQLDGWKFRRQQRLGSYIADFACLEAGLVIEADGSQHAEQVAYDDERTRFLEGEGFRVLRFWNNEVLANTQGVVESIWAALQNPSPLRGEGGAHASAWEGEGDGLRPVSDLRLSTQPDPSPSPRSRSRASRPLPSRERGEA